MASSSSSSVVWPSLRNLLSRTSPFTPEAFQPGPQNIDLLGSEDRCVLVVGAGGLGCEILKNLALSGFTNIHVIDIDTIELSNLNRQFLFRQSDIGRPKAEVAAEFIQRRCPSVRITPHHKKIQEFSPDFYSQFFLVVAGLDNVNARRWLNATLFGLVEFDEDGAPDMSTVIPLIDGGTEGFNGQARLFFPHVTSCYECSVDTLPNQQRFAMCTLASVPRLPEHCIAYALEVEWPKLKELRSASDYTMKEESECRDNDDAAQVVLDTDNDQHMQWLFARAGQRAAQFGIGGVTFALTQQVVKNIIPAIAATNAVIAAACANEALKVATWMSQPLNNYFMYTGSTGVYGRTFPYERRPDCIVCGRRQASISARPDDTLQDLIDRLKADPVLKLSDPGLATDTAVIWLSNKALRSAYEPNLARTLRDLFAGVVSDDRIALIVSDRQTLGDASLAVTVQLRSSADMDLAG